MTFKTLETYKTTALKALEPFVINSFHFSVTQRRPEHVKMLSVALCKQNEDGVNKSLGTVNYSFSHFKPMVCVFERSRRPSYRRRS